MQMHKQRLEFSCIHVIKKSLTNWYVMQTHKQSLQRKLQERQVEVQSKQQQLSSVLQESDSLRSTIASQTINKDDVARMNQEK